MEQIRSYRRRGSPDFPLAIYFNDSSAPRMHPKPEYHPETEIVWMTSGHAVLLLGGATCSFREGDIFVIPSNTVHYYQSVSPDAQWRSIVFGIDAITMHPNHFFQTTFTTPLHNGYLQLPPLLQPGHPVYDTVLAQLDRLCSIKIYTKDYKLQRFTALIALCTVLAPYCVTVTTEHIAQDPGNETVLQCMRYIHNHFSHKLTLETLAQECHLHPNYLCALFKNYTGQTIFEYITQFRIESAAALLKNQSLPAGKVCEIVGFRNESLFYRKFKQIMGMTPKAYANQHAGKRP